MTCYAQHELEPCLARLGIMPEDKPSFVKEVNAIDDLDILRQQLIEKERERQSIANDLEVAARLGLVISETNEAIQMKLAQLERENQMLHDELQSTHIHSTCDPSSDDGRDYNDDAEEEDRRLAHSAAVDEQIYLTQELDQARRELTKFRKEMDGLSAQLNDMASEMVDSRAKVSMYAKRLAEVEHKLATTRDMNSNLQALLEKAMTTQKQSSSNTSHLVKNIQTDLSRVVAENDQLRSRIAELENQQIETEERLLGMVAQAKEYASLLEQAQDTIHSLSEPRLPDDDTLSNGMSTTSSQLDGSGGKETEITKGPVFSAEFRQEMQKEIERNLNLRNEIRHRIITHDSISSDKKKAQEGLKYLLSDRDSGVTSSLSTSTSSSTASSLMSSVRKDHSLDDENHNPAAATPHLVPVTTSHPMPQINALRPANFLTGFSGFGSEGMGIGGMTNTKNFITRGMTPRNFTSATRAGGEPSISTRFFQRLATRLEDYEKSSHDRTR
ncbi:hypothetical protein DFQ28_008634 [Apophysomyces sp. BC1034]|nr:hypothetical protein DFQ30_008381 [Apophysomyces sp. BC1015]KAG0174778.1 hypothetical protein DFQ29_007363 [Apophysomyces sp. BC1021]KAG0185883.1 hypothetical protein DFQ28_008634 [Apophysomyces sp. BC1034]